MSGRPAVKILGWVLLGLLLLPLLVWVVLSITIKLTVLEDAPLSQAFEFVGQGLVQTVQCSLVVCEAELPEGIESTTFDEKLLTGTPVALDVDEFGRVLVAETGRQNRGAEDNRSHEYWLLDDLASRTVDDRRAYYRKWIEAGRIEDPDHFTSESDRLVALEDRDGDGVADTRSVVARWNEMASGLVAGVEAREGTIYATSIPSLYRIEDRDRDGEPESVDALVTGFGVKTSLIGHDLHGLAWGPDGMLYFSMGDRGYHLTLPDGRVLEPALGPGRGAVFRMHPDGSGLEVFATGVRNPQELAFDDYGNLFTGDNNGDGGDSARIVYLVEGSETGWAMPYQTLAGDYVRGPWMAERLWDLQHDAQPAWVLPPVAHIGNGPAGFVHYPGLGLPERYAGHFFLCDYAYMNGRSGIWSFALEPKGAGFEMVDRHQFAWSVLATDFDFSWDGRMFASVFDQIGVSQKIVEWRHADSRADPRVAEATRLAQGRMSERSTEALVRLLGFADQRIRLRAQYVLAERGAIAPLATLARQREAPLLARVHAVWALGQIGPAGLDALGQAGRGWVDAAPDELRAQIANAIGRAGARDWAPVLRGWLRDEAARVRFFAAQSLGALGDASAIPELVALLRENADRDVFLRHAAVWALGRMEDRESVWQFATDASRSVRLAVLLVLRNAADARVAAFLEDADPLLVVEAARAIYDGPIDGAMAALAGLAGQLEPVAAADEQTGQALHRRVIGANVRLRSSAGALALASYVEDETQLERLRALALEALGSYTRAPSRDLTMGFYRPLPEVEAEVLAGVFERRGRALIATSLGARALEIANQIGVIPLDDAELLELAKRTQAAPDERVSALRALAARLRDGADREGVGRAARRAVEAKSASVRNAGRDLLLALDPEAGLEAMLAAMEEGPSALDRQHALTRLGAIDDARARTALARAMARWESGDFEPAAALELLEAARAQGGALGEQAGAWLAPDVDLSPEAAQRVVPARAWALSGGDPGAGQRVFQTVGDCQRCHGGGGHGAGAGPDLAGVSARGARYVLESMLLPGAQIAEGFGSVVVTRRDGTTVSGLLVESHPDGVRLDVGESEPLRLEASEVASISEPTTGMPPMGLALEPRALRDVLAYVMSL